MLSHPNNTTVIIDQLKIIEVGSNTIIITRTKNIEIPIVAGTIQIIRAHSNRLMIQDTSTMPKTVQTLKTLINGPDLVDKQVDNTDHILHNEEMFHSTAVVMLLIILDRVKVTINNITTTTSRPIEANIPAITNNSNITMNTTIIIKIGATKAHQGIISKAISKEVVKGTSAIMEEVTTIMEVT